MAARKTTAKTEAGPVGPKLVKMKRDPEIYPEPHTADVHPDEVENYRPGGWEEA